LAIVKSILALHGGTVAIKSTPGAGTTVVLRFPGNVP
jgi:signal transduction histidine kinase